MKAVSSNYDSYRGSIESNRKLSPASNVDNVAARSFGSLAAMSSSFTAGIMRAKTSIENVISSMGKRANDLFKGFMKCFSSQPVVEQRSNPEAERTIVEDPLNITSYSPKNKKMDNIQEIVQYKNLEALDLSHIRRAALSESYTPVDLNGLDQLTNLRQITFAVDINDTIGFMLNNYRISGKITQDNYDKVLKPILALQAKIDESGEERQLIIQLGKDTITCQDLMDSFLAIKVPK